MADHSDKTMFVSSPIDVDTWNEAQWGGAAYLHDPSGSTHPAMGLLFRNEAAGRTIFTDWRARFGRKDSKEDLRIAIIEGDVEGQEHGYYIHIGFDPDRAMERAKEQGHPDPEKVLLTLITRIHRMTPPPGSPNLPNFKREFAKHGKYDLLPVFIVKGQLTPEYDLAIEKTKVIFRNVADVCENDLDYACFGPGGK